MILELNIPSYRVEQAKKKKAGVDDRARPLDFRRIALVMGSRHCLAPIGGGCLCADGPMGVEPVKP